MLKTRVKEVNLTLTIPPSTPSTTYIRIERAMPTPPGNTPAPPLTSSSTSVGLELSRVSSVSSYTSNGRRRPLPPPPSGRNSPTQQGSPRPLPTPPASASGNNAPTFSRQSSSYSPTYYFSSRPSTAGSGSERSSPSASSSSRPSTSASGSSKRSRPGTADSYGPSPQQLLSPLTIPTKGSTGPSSSLSSSSGGLSLAIPTTPLTPAPPSPCTMKRKRFSKLRRHFGDAPPIELVFPCGDYPPKAKSAELETMDLRRLKDSLIIVSRTIEVDSPGGSESDLGEEEEEEEDEVICLEGGKCSFGGDDDSSGDEEIDAAIQEQLSGRIRGVPPEDEEKFKYMLKRYSKKWVTEKSGRRLTTENYSAVLKQLREL